MYLHRIAESSINLNMYVKIYSPLNQYLLTTLDHHVSIKYKDWLKQIINTHTIYILDNVIFTNAAADV